MENELPLAGIKVLELATYAAVPATARILGDWGADVIKVESLRGDQWRHYGEIAEVPCTDEENPCFDVNDSNKRGISLDLRTDEGKAVLSRLLAWADVFVTNYRMSALKALHLTWEEVHASHPRLIWGRLSGYGSKGPEAARPGFDIAAFWSRSGLMVDYGHPGDAPLMPFHAFGDMTTGSVFVGGICAAVIKQLRTGIGERVEISLCGTASWLVGLPAVVAQSCYGIAFPRKSYEQSSPVCIPYQCADGEWIELCIMEYERYYPAFCQILGFDDWIDDPRYNTLAAVQQHMKEFVERVQAAFLTKPRDAWCPLLSAADIVYDKVSHFRDVLNQPQKWANNYVYKRHFANGHEALLPNTPIEFSEERKPAKPAPLLGEHNGEILREMGFSDEEIDSLLKKEVIAKV